MIIAELGVDISVCETFRSWHPDRNFVRVTTNPPRQAHEQPHPQWQCASKQRTGGGREEPLDRLCGRLTVNQTPRINSEMLNSKLLARISSVLRQGSFVPCSKA